MPWIIADYTSNVLDLTNKDTFRDLSQPIGALGSAERLQEFKTRFEDDSLDESERCLYNTHYSSPGYVIGFNIRKHPQWMIKFQSGKFDNPNRIFNSIEQEWQQCMTSPSCVKELTPEFYLID